MSVPKMDFVDTDSVDDQLDAGIDIIDDKGIVVRESPNAEYMLSGSEDNIVAYRILQLSDDSPKSNQTIHTTSATVNNSVTTTVPQQLQYIVIDSSNGFLQAVPTTQITAVPSTTIKVEPQTTSNSSSSNSLKMRTSVAIAPKIDYLPSTPYSSNTTNNSTVSSKSNTSVIDPLNSFKKRDDRRRATHNEVERRRRDKINHWIMKLGAIIPADGTSVEIGDSGRLSIAAIEGQSKGGILSKACEYVQMLQEKKSTRKNASQSADSRTIVEKKKYEDEIARLRGENELLKAILIKNGINYVKERTSFKSNEYS
ncbi:upstream stimulatory factor 1 isoform X2 [Sitodiplosis mosellana]|uniref:upstream stimulatory factor 1 isoform X2 n=1 Tax=Sitodiplosis mosellana TaxID=263140 RepID=UPI002443D0F6|nr:upstream stimulatory factor 1 isoform X2 [Sitodiplosis mosellana]